MQHSHLSTIITRVKRVARCNKDNPDERSRLHAILPHAFNLAEYLTHDNDYTEKEAKEARRLLDMLGLPHRVDEDHGLGYHEVMNKFLGDGKLVKIPGRRCRRCGKELSNETSISYGLGPICRTKQAKEEQIATAGLDKQEVLEGLEAIANEPGEEEGNPAIDTLTRAKPPKFKKLDAFINLGEEP